MCSISYIYELVYMKTFFMEYFFFFSLLLHKTFTQQHNNTVHNNIDSDAPWDAVRQLTDALTKRISDGSQQTLESVMNGRIN